MIFSLSVDSQDIQVVSSALVTTYTKEYTGTFGQPAPNARYHVHTVLLAREKRARISCVYYARKCARRCLSQAFSGKSLKLSTLSMLRCFTARQSFFFFPFYFFLAGKFYFENTTSFIQRHGSKIKKNFFRVHDCFGSYPSPRQLFCPTDSPGLAPTLPLIRHFALSEKLVLGEV